MSDLRKPMNDKLDIYQPSILKQKLDEDYSLIKPERVETGRSISSMKHFAPDKINTNRSNNEDKE